MNIKTTQIEKLIITNIEKLDPIEVICEDIEAGRGKITITCNGESWHSFWNSIGKNTTIKEFFSSCDEHYLAKNLSSIDASIQDLSKLRNTAQKIICKKRRSKELTEEQARILYSQTHYFSDDLTPFSYTLSKIVHSEWWHEIPLKANPRYQYLCRVIKAVKEAFKLELEKEAVHG